MYLCSMHVALVPNTIIGISSIISRVKNVEYICQIQLLYPFAVESDKQKARLTAEDNVLFVV